MRKWVSEEERRKESVGGGCQVHGEIGRKGGRVV